MPMAHKVSEAQIALSLDRAAPVSIASLALMTKRSLPEARMSGG